MNKDYYNLIEKVRDDQTVHSIELVDEGDEYIPSSDINDCAINYMDTLRMERAEPEQPVYKLVPMPKEEPTISDKHVVADTIITLHECDGMTPEFLFHQPSHGEYLEEITKEVL